jgi:protein-S-isoprenylcysteine O-methyltransferase Ste14
MRNPVKLKNLRLRLMPFYLVGLLLLLVAHPTLQSVGLGAIPVLLGVALRSWGAGHLVKTERFVVSGPYAHVRHPLYLGSFLIAVGFAVMLAGWSANLALAAVLGWFFLYYFPRKERVESARLRERYGEDYARYRSEVPALLPGWRVWPGARDASLQWSGARYGDNNELGTLLAVVVGVGLVLLRARFVS